MSVFNHWPKLLLFLVVFFQLLYVVTVSNRPNTIAPEGRVYNVLGKNFYYPSMIRQARDGSWGIKDTHTTRETPTVYAQIFFVVAGKLAALFSIDPVAMYQLLRITGLVSSTLVLFFLVRLFFPERYAAVATLLAVALESGPTLQSLFTQIHNLIPAWDVHIIYERRFSLPHHTWGDAFGFLFFGLLFKIFFNPPQTKKMLVLNSIILCLVGFAATSTLPSYIVPFTALAVPALLFVLLKQKTPLSRVIVPVLLATIGIAVAAIVLKIEFSKGSPWTEWTTEEKSWMTHSAVISKYLQTLVYYSPLLIAGIVGSLIRFRKMTTKLWTAVLLCLSWIIGPIPLILISHSPWFPFANLRLTDLHGYAPAGILSAIGIWHLLSIVPRGKKRAILGVIVGLVISSVSLFTTWQYTKQIYSFQNNFWTNIYPSKETWQGVLFMEQLPKGSNVMVREYFGEMLPAFGPVSVFIGGGHGFRDWLERQWISQHFYKGLLSDNDAKELLQKERITHVFWGPDERSLLQATTFYPTVLEPLYVNNDVSVFQVKQ